MIPSVRYRKLALSSLLLWLSTAVLLSPHAYAQDEAQGEAPSEQPEAPPPEDAGASDPTKDDDQDTPQAPPLLLHVPMPSSESQEATPEPQPAL